MVLDAYKRQADADRAALAPAAHPDDSKTLREILSNKRDSALFTSMLQQEAQADDALGDFALKLGAGESLTDEDLSELEKRRVEFLRKMKNVEEVSQQVTPEMISQIASSSPHLQKIVSLTGPESLARIFSDHLSDYAMREPDAFGMISRSINDLKQFKENRYSDLSEKIRTEVSKAGITEEAFAVIMQNPDASEREKALRTAITANYGTFKKAWNFLEETLGGGLRGTAVSWARELSGKKGEIDNALNMLDGYTKGIGNLLHVSLTKDDALRTMLTREIQGDKSEKPKQGLGFRDQKAMPTVFDEETQIEARWNALRERETGEDIEELKRRFRADEELRYRVQMRARGGGFWAWIRQALFGRSIDNVFNRTSTVTA